MSGCGKDESKKQTSSAPAAKLRFDAGMSTPAQFDQDIDRICHAEIRSGAIDMPAGYSKSLTVAQWLGNNLRTDKGRKFLGELRKKYGSNDNKKAAALAAQAKKSGVPDCPLVRTWGGK